MRPARLVAVLMLAVAGNVALALCSWTDATARADQGDAPAAAADPQRPFGDKALRRNAEAFLRRMFMLDARFSVAFGGVDSVSSVTGGQDTTLSNVDIGNERFSVSIDAVVVSVAPAVNGSSAFSVKLPAGRIEFRDNYRGVSAWLTMGSHELAGTWSHSFDLVEKMDLSVGHASLRLGDANERIEADALSVELDSAQTRPGRWRSAFSAEVARAQVIAPKGPVLSIGRLAMKSSASELRLALFAALRQAYWLHAADRAFEREYQYRARDAVPPRVAEFVHRIANPEPVLFADWRLELALQALAVHEKPSFTLAGATVALAFNGFDAPSSNIELRAGLDQLQPTNPGMPSGARQFVPHAATARVELARLPVGRLIQALSTSLSSGLVNQEVLGGMLALKLTSLLLAEGTAVQIHGLGVEAGRLLVKATGSVEFEPVAALLGVGQLDVSARGLDQVIEATQTGLLPPDVLEAVVPAQRMGLRLPSQDGLSTHRYAFRFTRAGEFLVNGRDLRAAFREWFGFPPVPPALAPTEGQSDRATIESPALDPPLAAQPQSPDGVATHPGTPPVAE